MLSVEARRKRTRLVLRLLAQGMTRAEAARAAKISRQHLYRVLVQAGQLGSAEVVYGCPIPAFILRAR